MRVKTTYKDTENDHNSFVVEKNAYPIFHKKKPLQTNLSI